LASIFLTVPVSSASCERAFSCLKRLKIWLCNTIGQERFFFFSFAHMDIIELLSLDLEKIIEIFASKKGRRMEFN